PAVHRCPVPGKSAFDEARLGGLAHVQRTPVGAAEGGRDTALAGHALAQAAPAVRDAVFTQMAPDDLHELVGQYGNEQVSGAAFLFLMEDRRRPSSDLSVRNTASRSVSMM